MDNLTQQPAIRLDYQLSSKLRVTGKYSGQRARKLITPGTIPGFTDVLNPYPFITNYGATVELHDEPDDLHRGHLRVHPQPARRRRSSARRHAGTARVATTRRTG